MNGLWTWWYEDGQKRSEVKLEGRQERRSMDRVVRIRAEEDGTYLQGWQKDFLKVLEFNWRPSINS